jgi:hypothetical protein
MNQRPKRRVRRQRKISRPSKPSAGESRPRSPMNYLVVVVALLVTLAAAHELRSSWNQPDPNFVSAQKMVSRYEMGRELADRNYRHPVYREAQSKLKKVDSRSISAEPAAELSARIKREASLFDLGRESVRITREAATHDRRARAEDAAASVLATARIMPPAFDPDCEDEESADHDDHMAQVR